MLILRESHAKTLHGGPQLMVSHTVRKYWITHIQVLTKQIYREYVTCARFAARTLNQIMGNLPEYRVNSIRPFLACGVDYAGPAMMSTTKGRGHKVFRLHMCICMLRNKGCAFGGRF